MLQCVVMHDGKEHVFDIHRAFSLYEYAWPGVLQPTPIEQVVDLLPWLIQGTF